jgi:hypothetical protein
VFGGTSAFQVHVGLRANRPVAAPTLTLELRSQTGTRIFSTSRRLELDDDETAQLVYEVDRLPLLGGDYDLTLSATDGPFGGSVDRTVHFSVAREPGDEGVVDLRGTWRSLSAIEGLR